MGVCRDVRVDASIYVYVCGCGIFQYISFRSCETVLWVMGVFACA